MHSPGAMTDSEGLWAECCVGGLPESNLDSEPRGIAGTRLAAT